MNAWVPLRVLCYAFSALEQFFFSQQCDDLLVVLRRPRLLQPVDFPLQGGAFPVVPEFFERSNAVGHVGRGSRLAGDLLDECSFSFT